MKKVKHVGIIIALCPHNGKVLMGKRSLSSNNSCLWDFFGGRINDDEEPMDGAIREFTEETGLFLKKQFVKHLSVITSSKKVLWIYLASVYNLTRIKLSKEHSTYRWFTPEEAENKKLNSNAKKAIQTIRELI